MRSLLKLLGLMYVSGISVSCLALANPASVNCVNNGNKLVMIQNTGICVFQDGSYCEEWAYFRGKCQQGDNDFPGGKFNPNQKRQYCISKINNVTIVEMCPGTPAQ